MALGVFLYRAATRLLSPFAGLILKRRVVSGKEHPANFEHRFARALPVRPEGPVIWLHGASVGESLLLLRLAEQIAQTRPSASFLFTCQTLTAAARLTELIKQSPDLSGRWAKQVIAPLDLPGAAKRFVRHWRPDLTLIAEGDIWPNLMRELKRADLPAALINARMTDKSIAGWRRWPGTALRVFSVFNLLIASDKRTQTGLRALAGRDVPMAGNLKSALPPPDANERELEALQSAIGERPILLAASTHDGEESIIIDTLLQMSPPPFTIIAPRHPERGDWIESLLSCTEFKTVRRSRDETVQADTNVLLADTLGEMGLWFRLADTVYLGGGHAPGVGGHNPMEPLRLGKTVLTGPSLFNFQDMAEDLIKRGCLQIVESPDEIAALIPSPRVSDKVLQDLEASAFEPMNQTLSLLEPLLEQHIGPAP